MNDTDHRPARVAEVARAAGVSTQTVSRVINGVSTVSAENVKRVKDAMRELGYRPNPAARMLKQREFHTLGVATYNTFATGQLDTLMGIANAAKRAGYALTLSMFDPDEGDTFESVIDKMLDLPVDGIIFVAGWLAVDPPVIELPSDKMLTIVTSRSDIPYPTVGENPEEYAHMAVSHLIELGHTHIAHISGPAASFATQQRIAGWKRALQEHDLPVPELYQGDWTADSGFAAGLDIACDPDITAVYASNDAMAYGLVQALEICGRNVPGEISVIGTDDSLAGTVPNLDISSIRLGADEIGDVAVRRTIEAIKSGKQEIFHHQVSATLVHRGSVRDIRKH